MGSESGVLIPSLNSLGGLILMLTALSGELPMSLIERLHEGRSYRRKVLNSLKSKKLVRAYNKDRLRGLRLTASAKSALLESWPRLFGPAFSGETVTNAPSYKIADRLRLHRMAEVLVTMLNAGVSVYPWEKPDVFGPTPLDVTPHFDGPTYYNSREFRHLGEQSAKITSSRATGILLGAGNIFAVYNTGPGLMKWSNKAETRLSAVLKVEACQTRLSWQFGNDGIDAILFGADMSQLPGLLGFGGNQPHQGLLKSECDVFQHFYYLTSDHHGEVILQLLSDPDQKARFHDMFAQDMAEPRDDWFVVNDGFYKGSTALIGCTCDVPRIRTFSSGLEAHEQTGALFCFDFQVEALKRICCPNVNILPINFDLYERKIFHQPQKSD